jgi:hypothetical protein
MMLLRALLGGIRFPTLTTRSQTGYDVVRQTSGGTRAPPLVTMLVARDIYSILLHYF